jgi:hypothetical protein
MSQSKVIRRRDFKKVVDQSLLQAQNRNWKKSNGKMTRMNLIHIQFWRILPLMASWALRKPPIGLYKYCAMPLDYGQQQNNIGLVTLNRVK